LPCPKFDIKTRKFKTVSKSLLTRQEILEDLTEGKFVTALAPLDR